MSKKLIQAAAGAAGGEPVYVEDVFSTYIYDGASASKTITNDIDLSGEGGLIWTKRRDGTARTHILVDTERGAGNVLNTDGDYAEYTMSGMPSSFNSDGYTITSTDAGVNDSSYNYVSWTFRKQAGFFDVVTFSTVGDGTAQSFSHNLGSVPAVMIVKKTSSSRDWYTYHKDLNGGTNPEQKYIVLNSTATEKTSSIMWADTAPTSTQFTVGGVFTNSGNEGDFVAYLFAHDDQSFGDDSDESIIKCGSFTTDGSGLADVNLGWEPQWILVKPSNVSGFNWYMNDSMRPWPTDNGSNYGNNLYANLSNAEGSGDGRFYPTSTGFSVYPSQGIGTGTTCIYIAIRRPMKTPESGTDVFAVDDAANGLTSGFPVDWFIRRTFSNSQNYTHTRLCGETFLTTDSTDAEQASSPSFDNNEGVYAQLNNSAIYGWMFKRATGFFDVVAYTGTEVSGRTISHNLGVIPELIICKGRNQSGTDWTTYDSASGATKYMQLNSSAAAGTYTAMWNDTAPTASVFTVGDSATTNGPSNYNYVAYLFATVAGVSKVGSYTGTGSDQNIDCGFSSGARFVLIKRTDDTAHWNLFDSVEQGIVAGNDPHIRLNANTAQETADDLVDPYSSGFTVTGSNGNVNASGGSYIFLAIA